MADFTLSNGDEITFDLDKLTFGEWQDMRTPAFARKQEVDVLSKVCNLDEKIIKSLSMVEAKSLYAELIKKVIRPTDEKN